MTLARAATAEAIGTALLPRLPGLRQALETKGPYKADAASAGRRALRNELLGLAALAAPEDGAALCERQFETGDNLTDRLAALAAMTLIPGERRERLITRFARSCTCTHRAEPTPIAGNSPFRESSTSAARRTAAASNASSAVAPTLSGAVRTYSRFMSRRQFRHAACGKRPASCPHSGGTKSTGTQHRASPRAFIPA